MRFPQYATCVLGLFACGLSGPPAAAQLAHTQLLGFLAQPPLHARIAGADAAVIADIDAVATGRIRLGQVVPIFGITGAGDLLVKRAPTNPPPLVPGERALLLLKGSRSPYVLAGAYDDILKITGSEMEARWVGAVTDLRRALAGPAEMAASYLAWVYLAWLDQPESDLRRAAILGLGDRRAAFHPLSVNLIESLVRAASDPALDFGLRRVAAFVAGRSVADQPALSAGWPQIRRDLDRLNVELQN